ncbi:hypothetical protein CTRG_05893 [Candida tropicalis MYA-3404]|uniref:PRELI/MSF1 domain-containing protein n=1 Tax=Candida tropicalis (strain ATCC MYA-3404 / T1) TaxID=294747 RepID=C5MIK0_CANTT|nr:hypothetical protein CTRG_05893 [Candida tropicalis MYA-3404]EER30494.1 hypothetical protein CTRG_05893 [Candida tropicalis MYA-3404]KAG4406357.1 hypothetical protein JTP64_003741 [Candida tropicalis]MCP8715888.1 PRELI/slowmo family protein [Asgard group archaeon]
MVLYFENKHNFNFDFETTSLAYFNRYPNPYSKHVLSIDTIESFVDSKGQLNTTRLIVKTGRLPNFIKPFLGNNLNSWIIEKSVIDPNKKVLYSYTSNLDHRKFIRVEEFLKYKSTGLEVTSLESKVKFSSNLFGFKEKIEKWSHNRFSTNMEKSKLGLQFAMMRLKEKGGLFSKDKVVQYVD